MAVNLRAEQRRFFSIIFLDFVLRKPLSVIKNKNNDSSKKSRIFKVYQIILNSPKQRASQLYFMEIIKPLKIPNNLMLSSKYAMMMINLLK